MLQLSFVSYKKGSCIVIEGDLQNDRFYIIQNGKVRFSREFEVLPEVNGNILGPGDFIGVISCLCNHSQLETVTALTDVVLIAVKREQYPDLIEKNTPVAMKIIMAFSQKTRLLNDILASRTSTSAEPPDLERMYSIASFYDTSGRPDAAMYMYYQYMKLRPNGTFIPAAKKRFLTLQQRVSGVALEPKTGETVCQYPAGAMIFCEMQPGEDMFIIQDGQVEITRFVSNNDVVLAVLKKGDFFGEMALLENMPRSASALAHTACKLMIVNRKNFNTMVATQSQLIARLTTTLADRLWSMYRQIANTFIPEEQVRLFDMLALQIEKLRSTQNSLQLDLTLQDLANMCAIPPARQQQALAAFKSDRRIKIVENKICVSESQEIVKLAALFRKKK